MSSLIAEYRSTEQAIADLQARLAQLQSDGKLKEELEFEGKLRGLLGEYGKSLKEVIAIMDPKASNKLGGSKASEKTEGTRKARQVKQYKNPNNGEVIETKGGNHKTLKEWKATWGAETVESWATILG